MVRSVRSDVLLGVYRRVGAVSRLRTFKEYSEELILTGVARQDEPCGLILSGTEDCGKLSVRTVVFSERAKDRDPSTDERFELKREGIGGRGGSVSNRATGREFSKSAIRAS